MTSTGSREISGWEVTKLPGICNVSLVYIFFFFPVVRKFNWRPIKLQHKRVLETQFMSLVLSDFSKFRSISLYKSSAILSELSLSVIVIYSFVKDSTTSES